MSLISQKQRTAYSISAMAFSLIAWLAALTLTSEGLKLKQDPNHRATCDFGGIFSCTSIMKTDQAHIFGFPNSYIGLVGFAITFILALLLFINRKKENSITKYIPLLLQLGVTIGICFITFFFITSVFVVSLLCPWCMVVWTMTIPFFLYTTLYNLQLRRTQKDGEERTILSPAILSLVIIIGYLLPLTIAVVRFALLSEPNE